MPCFITSCTDMTHDAAAAVEGAGQVEGAERMEGIVPSEIFDIKKAFAEIQKKMDMCLMGIGELRVQQSEFDRLSSPRRRSSSIHSSPGWSKRNSHASVELNPILRAVGADVPMEGDEAGPRNSDGVNTRESDGGDKDTKKRTSIVSIEGAKAFIENRRRGRPKVFDQIWRFLEDPECNRYAGYYAKSVHAFTLMTVCFTLAQTIPDSFICCAWAGIVEVCVDVFFSLELILSFFVCPSRISFVKDAYNIIDLLAVLPLAARLYTGITMMPFYSTRSFTAALLYLCVPILRLLKMLRRFQQFRLLIGAFELALEVLPFLIFAQILIALIFSAAVFLLERDNDLDTFPRTVWYTLVTMTTVGYGDVYPVTPEGTVMATFLVVTSVLYMAMPLGIIGHAFTTVWEDRDQILLVAKTRARLAQWGYTPHDIPVLFELFDHSGTGELTLHDFTNMINQMKIGLKERRIIQLFDSIDTDHGGSIDGKEFVRALFPDCLEDIYGFDSEFGPENDDNDQM
eukprot:TRINITY_DN20992_c0_g1_i1.p1 TRINITY_DN20992_c0_g1~~TRINITY_DN20992_c0_g1_i1.p1  ORF type:complete len:513 (+),score=65.66 TRINITY_DN20992_c0_g1_i1:62-1600(+)